MTEWVSFIQGPPTQSSHPSQVIRYLSRYLSGGPLSDHRLVSADSDTVTFLAREGTTPDGDSKQVPIRLSTQEFLRRWCLHVLPKGFTKPRRFGGWFNRRCEDYLEHCAILMEGADVPISETALDFDVVQLESMDESEEDGLETCPSCVHCGGALQPLQMTERPSWRVVFESLYSDNYFSRLATIKITGFGGWQQPFATRTIETSATTF